MGLGANLGRPRQTLGQAVQALAERLDPGLRAAALYRSTPIGPPQPDFLNSAVSIHGERDLPELLQQLQALEVEFGRQRNLRWGPRTLDLDILWASYASANQPDLVVPHPGLFKRAFALMPSLDLEPKTLHRASADPRAAEDLQALAASLAQAQGITRVADPGWHRTGAKA